MQEFGGRGGGPAGAMTRYADHPPPSPSARPPRFSPPPPPPPRWPPPPFFSPPPPPPRGYGASELTHPNPPPPPMFQSHDVPVRAAPRWRRLPPRRQAASGTRAVHPCPTACPGEHLSV